MMMRGFRPLLVSFTVAAAFGIFPTSQARDRDITAERPDIVRGPDIGRDVTGPIRTASDLPRPNGESAPITVAPGISGLVAQLDRPPKPIRRGSRPARLSPFPLPPAPLTAPDPQRFNPNQIVIKFRDGAPVRLGAAAFVVEPGSAGDTAYRLARAGLEPQQVTTDIAKLNSLLRRVEAKPDPASRALSRRQMTNLRLRAERASGHELPDLNQFYFVQLEAPPEEAARLLTQIQRFRSIEAAYFQPIPSDAVDIPPLTTINLTAAQGYRTAAPAGIDADFATLFAGGGGQGVRIVDVEVGWSFDHEDMPATPPLMGAGLNLPFRDHGTAVVGMLSAPADAIGINGMAPGAAVGWSSAVFVRPFMVGYSVAEGLLASLWALRPGDIALIEQHYPTLAGPCPNTCNCAQFGYVPVERFPFEFAVISLMTRAGVIVVEAAGNGQMTVTRTSLDSGAIMVGAANSPAVAPVRAPACFTNSGSRVDVHAWGDSISTLGYGGVPGGAVNPALRANGLDSLQWYTSNFGGTSGASPMVTAAAAVIQGARAAEGLPRLSPAAMRALLIATGTPQATNAAGARIGPNIGPQPDLRRAIMSFIPDRGRFISVSAPPFPATPGQAFTAFGSVANTGSGVWSGGHRMVVVSSGAWPPGAPGVAIGSAGAPQLPSQTASRAVPLSAPAQPGTYSYALQVRSPTGQVLATSASQTLVVAGGGGLFDSARLTIVSAPGSLSGATPGIVVITATNDGTSTWQPGAQALRLTRTGALALAAQTVGLIAPVPPGGSATMSFVVQCTRVALGAFNAQMNSFGQSVGRNVACQP